MAGYNTGSIWLFLNSDQDSLNGWKMTKINFRQNLQGVPR